MHERSIFPFLRLFLCSEIIFQHHDRGLTKFQAGSEQPLVCVVIDNSSYPTVKNNTAYHAFGKYWMQARGFLNYRLKYCRPKVIYCICQPNELKREIKKKLEGPNGVQAKIWGFHGPPRPPLESPLTIRLTSLFVVFWDTVSSTQHGIHKQHFTGFLTIIRLKMWQQQSQTNWQVAPRNLLDNKFNALALLNGILSFCCDVAVERVILEVGECIELSKLLQREPSCCCKLRAKLERFMWV